MAMLLCTGCSSTVKESKTADTSVPEPQVAVSADSLYSFVERQVAMGPRTPATKAHSACGDMIVTQLHRYGVDTVVEQRSDVITYEWKHFTARNIFGQINPKCNNRVLLLAHYDTRPWADNDPDPAKRTTPVLGANDGASGVAVLLEAARVLGQNKPDNVGIDLLFVDMEDSGEESGDEDTWCLGTQEWVRTMPYTDDNRPKLGILLDMVGGRDAKFYREYFSEQYASPQVARIWAVARESGFGDRFINTSAGGVVDDHIYINRAGIPCVDIIECANDATGTFPPTWHTTSDNLAAIDRATLKAVAQTVINTILQ